MDSPFDTVNMPAREKTSKRGETPEQRERRLLRQRKHNKRRLKQSFGEQNDLAPSYDGERESENHYQERLAKQRAYAQRRRTAQAGVIAPPPSIPSDVPRDDMDQSMSSDSEPLETASCEGEDVVLSPPTAQCVDEIRQALARALGAQGLDEVVCGVCDRLALRLGCRHVTENDIEYLQTMKRALKVPHISLPSELVSHYGCGAIDSQLRGFMLAKRGVTKTSTGFIITVCDECVASLKTKIPFPPKLSVANGFYVGELPRDLQQATWIENVITQLVTVIAQTRVLRGGEHRAIRSHCMVFDSTPGPPATLLPRRVDRDGAYRVILAGPFTKAQTERIQKLHSVRGEMVCALMNFYKQFNRLYEYVQIDSSLIHENRIGARVLDEIGFIQDEGSRVDEEQDSVHGRSDEAGVATEEDECTLIERNVLLAPDATIPDINVASRVIDLNAHEKASVPHLRIDHSSHFANASCIEAKMYPHLFPFGRGHPDEIRAVKVSKL